MLYIFEFYIITNDFSCIYSAKKTYVFLTDSNVRNYVRGCIIENPKDFELKEPTVALKYFSEHPYR